jgi:uncharacterized protein (DUF342 family)
MSESTSHAARLEVQVSEDNLCAWIEVREGLHPGELASDRLSEALKQADIEINEAVKQRLAEIAADPLGAIGRSEQNRLILAEGTAPTDPEPEQFIWAEEHLEEAPPEADTGEAIDYFKIQHIKTFVAGTDIGLIQPYVSSITGRDVYGQELRPRSLSNERLNLGAGLSRQTRGDGDHLVTTITGRVIERNGQIWIEEVMSLPGDIDFGTGSIDSKISIDVAGAIRANFSVTTTGSLVVHGTIEAADIKAGEDITCLKGIVGQPDKGTVQAGGVVCVRFINDAKVSSEGGIRVERSVMNSNLSTQSQIEIKFGTLVGGTTYAREQIVVRTLGSNAAVPTQVICGLSPQVIARSKALDDQSREQEAAAEKIKNKTAPYVAMLKRLNAQQREMVTDLLAQADELSMAAEDLARQRDALLAQAGTHHEAQVVASDRIHAGVSLVFGHREVQFSQDLLGPVRVTERELDGAVYIVAINMNTGSVTRLNMREVDLTPFLPTDAGETEDD